MQVGQYGSQLSINTSIDLSAFDNITINVLRPDQTVFTVNNLVKPGLIIVANAPLGVINYTLQKGDISIPGLYSIQAFLKSTTNNVGIPTAVTTFQVLPGIGTLPW